jgi:two-component system chemotaxis sensor kinase CheA
MDVVAKNIEGVGGSVLVDSKEGEGTTITLKIPLTLAIIEGMNIKIGESRFTVPIMSIQESFRPKNSEIFKDPEGNRMIMVRGNCYPVLKLHEFYDIETEIISFDKGIILMVEEDGKSSCIFADELLGEQQVVVKALPEYIKKFKNIKGLGGCTLLGDGSISLILDVGQLELSAVTN